MKNVELNYSKSQIDRAGENLKKGGVKGLEAFIVLDTLSNWRAFHAMPLDTFAKVLKARVKKISQSDNAIVAQRVQKVPKGTAYLGTFWYLFKKPLAVH